MTRKPVIGITPSPTALERPHGVFHTYGIADTYTTAVEAAGGVPVIIPPQDGNAAQLAGLVDGLLSRWALPGAGSVHRDRPVVVSWVVRAHGRSSSLAADASSMRCPLGQPQGPTGRVRNLREILLTGLAHCR